MQQNENLKRVDISFGKGGERGYVSIVSADSEFQEGAGRQATVFEALKMESVIGKREEFDLLEWRMAKVEGVGPWVWLKKDFWAWMLSPQEFAELRDVFLKWVSDRRVIVSAGGCLGMYPRLWCEHFELVYTFEPDPLNFACLTLNCNSPSICRFNYALGETEGICKINHGPEYNAGAHSIELGEGYTRVVPLDAFGLQVVDAIQLDVERFEPQVLRGAIETIERCRPVISVEDDVPESRDFLLSLGYREVARVGTNPDIVFVPV